MKSSIFTALRAAIMMLCASAAIISPAQAQFNTVLSFDGGNGANPHYVTLVQGEDGELYGTTFVSTGSGGTVFKVTTGGLLTTLHTFCEGGYPCKDGAQPNAGLKTAAEMFQIAAGSALEMQENSATLDTTDAASEEFAKRFIASHDANDFLYAVNASRNYNPSPQLEKIIVPVMFVNSADDFVNPPELGIAEREIKRVKNGRFVLLPISEQTHGHGTHTWAAAWQRYLKELLESSQH